MQPGSARHCLERGAAIWRAESELARMPGRVWPGKETENAAFVPSSVYTSCWEVPENEWQARVGLSQGDRGNNAEAPGRLRSAEHPRTPPGNKVRLTSAAAIAPCAGWGHCGWGHCGPDTAGRLQARFWSRSQLHSRFRSQVHSRSQSQLRSRS